MAQAACLGMEHIAHTMQQPACIVHRVQCAPHDTHCAAYSCNVHHTAFNVRYTEYNMRHMIMLGLLCLPLLRCPLLSLKQGAEQEGRLKA